jgi:hypothetical protein
MTHVAHFWFRNTFARRWPSYLALVLLIGAVGGVAMGSLSGARRTASSYNTFLASTNPSDMSVLLYARNISSELAGLPLVRRVSVVAFYVGVTPAGSDGAPGNYSALQSGAVYPVGSAKSEYFSQDRVSVIAGRLANPKKVDEFMMTAEAEHLMGWHVGQSIRMFTYSAAQLSLPNFGTAKVKPRHIIEMKLVGTVVLNDQVVLDEVDRYPTFMIFTPAISQPYLGPGLTYLNYSLQLRHGARDVPTVEREIIKALPKGTTYTFHVLSTVVGQVNRSIEPEAIALGVFGLIAGLAAMIIAGGLVARALQTETRDLDVLRALGANRAMIAASTLVGVVSAVVLGGLLAVAIGVALSPLSPIGPVRAVYPTRGFAFDWTVLGIGFAVLVVALVAIALVVTQRQLRRVAARSRRTAYAGSRLTRRLGDLGVSVTTVIGVRFATDPGREREAVPVRSALLGGVLAVTLVVATVTFGSGLHTLISRPALYGWNWTYALSGSGSDVPPQSLHLLSTDPYVQSWSTIDGFPNIQIEGTTVPVISMEPHAKVGPPVVTGHGLDANNQILLGAATMAALHKHLGDTVVAGYGNPKDAPVYVPPTRLTIVGTVTLPAVGNPLTVHTSMGVGGIISKNVEPATMRKFLDSPYATLNGPKMVLIRIRSGVSLSRARASLEKIANIGNRELYAVPNGLGQGDSVGVLSVQYPAEIENYRSIGATPAVLALALAGGAVIAIALTLTASVHRRRRDLALLRALGFLRRQLMATIAWQASVVAFVGVALGVPLGIIVGRWLWTLFANSVDAVPEPTVPALTVVIVSLSALVLANIVAALPGRSAARTSTADVLRGE